MKFATALSSEMVGRHQRGGDSQVWEVIYNSVEATRGSEGG